MLGSVSTGSVGVAICSHSFRKKRRSRTLVGQRSCEAEERRRLEMRHVFELSLTPREIKNAMYMQTRER